MGPLTHATPNRTYIRTAEAKRRRALTANAWTGHVQFSRGVKIAPSFAEGWVRISVGTSLCRLTCAIVASACLCVYVGVCVSRSLSVSADACRSSCVCLSVSVCLSPSVCASAPACLSPHVCLWSSVCLPLSACVCPLGCFAPSLCLCRVFLFLLLVVLHQAQRCQR